MASGPPSLPTLYKHQLRSLNPNLPQVIEHLVEVDILTRTEASKVVSTSDQFNRLCQLLASKGDDRKSTILSEIESFRGSLQEPTDRHLREGSAPQHHKHMHNGQDKRKHRDENGVRIRQVSWNSPEQTQTVEKCNGSFVATQCKVLEMDPFIVQFYTLISQLLWSGSHDQSHDPSHTPIPLWLRVDLSRDQILTYFPSQLRKSVKSLRSTKNHDQLEPVSLSSLLSVFKSFVKKTDTLVHESKRLAGKARLVQSLTERNAHLEDEVWRLRKPTDTHPPQLNGDRTFTPPREDLGGDAQLKKRLISVESRNRELTTINEQWAIESQERASELKVVQIQLEDAEAERVKLECKLKTYQEQSRKPCADKSQSKMKLLGSECSGRKWVGDTPNEAGDLDVKLQLQRERDEAVEEIIHLKAELEVVRRQREEDRDEMEELRDRADNLKVQAQSKLPTLKELTALSSENRQLRETVEREQAEKKALLQKIREFSQCSTQLCNGTDRGHSLGDCEANKSSVLVQPLMTDDDLTCLSGGGGSTSSAAAPIFFDSTPLAPLKSSTSNKTKLLQTNGDATNDDEKCHSFKTVSSISPPMTSRTPRSPPPPNQPVAEVIRGMRLSVIECERQCPTCLTVFMMLGEREFQSHVAGCHRTF